jgi:hypothetical protein
MPPTAMRTRVGVVARSPLTARSVQELLQVDHLDSFSTCSASLTSRL